MTSACEEQQFDPVTQADGESRVALGVAGTAPGQLYRIERHPDGVIILTPLASVPAREVGVWRDPELAETISQGIEQVNRGEGHDLGSFSQYLDDED